MSRAMRLKPAKGKIKLLEFKNQWPLRIDKIQNVQDSSKHLMCTNSSNIML